MQMNYAPGIFSKPYERKTNAFSAAGFANPAILILKIRRHPQPSKYYGHSSRCALYPSRIQSSTLSASIGKL
jgi:hypothetical protein